jgi:ApaG protein
MPESYEKETEKIRVIVRPKFLPEESDPARSLYFFSYHIRITNERGSRVQLLSRQWTICDAQGGVEEVEGPGVVGLTPVIETGKTFEYSSFCPLRTPTGSMRGHFHMVGAAGEKIKVEVPTFILSEPTQYH